MPWKSNFDINNGVLRGNKCDTKSESTLQNDGVRSTLFTTLIGTNGCLRSGRKNTGKPRYIPLSQIAQSRCTISRSMHERETNTYNIYIVVASLYYNIYIVFVALLYNVYVVMLECVAFLMNIKNVT